MTATSTYKSFLMKKTGETYSKLIDIVDYPDLGGEPELLDTTTLSDKIMTNILGIQSADAMEFNANYDPTDFQTLKALENTTGSYAVWFGATESGSTVTPTGTEGKFEFDGMLSVRVTGAGVNEVRRMVITIAASTPITFSVATA